MYYSISTLSLDGLSIDEDTSDDNGRGRKNTQSTTSSWSSSSSLFSNSTVLSSMTTTSQQEDNEEQSTFYYHYQLNDFFSMHEDDKKKEKLCEILSRSASHGDIQMIKQIIMDERLSPYLNLDVSDDDGSTPLIYASCFGKLEVVKYLLEMGAKLDVQDKIGWTALMWATTNGHNQIVQVLLDYSASSETKSLSGRTIYDLVDTENEKIVSILYDKSTHKMKERKLNRRKSNIPLVDDLKMITDSSNQQQQEEEKEKEQEELNEYQASFRSVHKFNWDECLPDQMFVFAEKDIDHILNVSISHLELPLNARSEIYVPANIIFLCARYAHYYTNRELVYQLLSKAIERIKYIVKSNRSDIHILAFWIANLSQLLFYLKKDVVLVVATAEYQLEISELISEAYTLLIIDSERRIDCILEPSMLEFEQIDGLDVVEFADDWHRFFRRNRLSSISSTHHRKSINCNTPSSIDYSSLQPPLYRTSLSPQSVTSLLTSTLYVLQSYDVQPVIVIQAIAQLFHFLSCELFNIILSNRKYLCRSRALQIRMNLTIIEEWIREHQLPLSLNAYFKPVIQLVQLLQCVSQLAELIDFISTIKSFDLLNPMQVKRLILNYRYEVSESRIPEEIEKYTMQIAEDTLRSIQLEKQEEKNSISTSNNNSSRPSSVSSLGSLLMYSISQQQQHNNNNNNNTVSHMPIQNMDYSSNNRADHSEDDVCLTINNSNNSEDDVGREWTVEKRDSKYMLPFSLPTTTNMVHSGWNSSSCNDKVNITQDTLQDQNNKSLSDTIYYELKQKIKAEREKNARERSVIPTIPEDWLQRLDRHSHDQI